MLFLILAAGLRADWIELKDGTRIDGSISAVSPESIIIEVQSTPTIREEKSYPRADVAKFQRSTQDDLAFEEITKTPLPATADSPAAFDAEPGKAVRKFIADYPYSKHVSAARRLASDIDAERARVEAGEIKIDGEWIAAAEWQADKGELAARLQLSKMKQAQDPVEALKIFEVIEKTRNTTSSYPEAIRLAIIQVDTLRAQIPKMRTDLELRQQQQEQGLVLASEDRRILLQQGIEQERATNQAVIEAARASGSKWPPLVADKKVLEDLERAAGTERTRLAAIDTTGMEAAIAAAREAEGQIAAGELDQARESLAKAEKLWAQYLGLSATKDALKKAESAAPAATPGPATTTP